MTDDQWQWLQCQVLLDQGMQACPQCDALGAGLYCAACGERLAPVLQECRQCHVMGGGAYCSHCGGMLQSDIAEAMATGTFDWVAWGESVQRWRGGFTLQEQQLLFQNGGLDG